MASTALLMRAVALPARALASRLRAHPEAGLACQRPRAPRRERIARLSAVAGDAGGDSPAASPATSPPASSSPPARLGVLSSGAVLVPHPDKAEKGGEDACFVLRDHGAFGVMDGVGGWADEGVDPAAYSNTFAEKAAAAVLMGVDDPRAVIAEAHEHTRVVGSATACVAVLDGAPLPSEANDPNASYGARVRIGNLGDAGAMIARGAEVVFSTPAQQHEFNCPFQLGWREFYPESDKAEDAETFAVDCRPGDALIMGSDGLWDNVPPWEAAEVCAALMEEGKDAQEVAEAIATRAFEHSVDEEYDSPFTVEARKNGYDVEWWEKAQGKLLVGGKMDDIAVVVAFLAEKEKCPPPAADPDPDTKTDDDEAGAEGEPSPDDDAETAP